MEKTKTKTGKGVTPPFGAFLTALGFTGFSLMSGDIRLRHLIAAIRAISFDTFIVYKLSDAPPSRFDFHISSDANDH